MKFTKSVFTVGLLISQAYMWGAASYDDAILRWLDSPSEPSRTLDQAVAGDPEHASLVYRNNNVMYPMRVWVKSGINLTINTVFAGQEERVLSPNYIADTDAYRNVSIGTMPVVATHSSVAGLFFDPSYKESVFPLELRRTDLSQEKIVVSTNDRGDVVFHKEPHSEGAQCIARMRAVRELAKKKHIPLYYIMHMVNLESAYATDSVLNIAEPLTDDDIIEYNSNFVVENYTGVPKRIVYGKSDGTTRTVQVAPGGSCSLGIRSDFGGQLSVESETLLPKNPFSSWVQSSFYEPKKYIDCSVEQSLPKGKKAVLAIHMDGSHSFKAVDMNSNEQNSILYNVITHNGDPNKVQELEKVFLRMQAQSE